MRTTHVHVPGMGCLVLQLAGCGGTPSPSGASASSGAAASSGNGGGSATSSVVLDDGGPGTTTGIVSIYQKQ